MNKYSIRGYTKKNYRPSQDFSLKWKHRKRLKGRYGFVIYATHSVT